MIDEKFLKIGSDIGAFQGAPGDQLRVGHEAFLVIERKRKIGFKPRENFMLPLAVDLNIFHQANIFLQLRAIFGVVVAEDSLPVDVFLMVELVARKG